MSRQSRLKALEKRNPELDKVTRIKRPVYKMDGTVTEKYVRVLQDGEWINHFEILIDGHWIRKD